MEDRPSISAGKTYVPNRYTVWMNPATLAEFASFQKSLEAQLADYLMRRAEERGLRFVGRPAVWLAADPRMRPERARVEARMMDHSAAESTWQQSQEPAPESAAGTSAIPTEQADYALLLRIGPRQIAMQGDQLTVGRGLENDIIVDDQQVSRSHARFANRGGRWMVEDLGSSHGTYVNGQRVQRTLLRAGDQVRVGATVLHLERLRVSSDSAASPPDLPPRGRT
jgi:hypothetical protein